MDETRSARNDRVPFIPAPLEEMQARLQAIISAAMDAIISINSEQRIVLFNASAERVFGLSAAEALGQHIDRVIPARYREAHVKHVENFGRTGTTARRMGALGALTGVRANGEEFPIEASISQVEVGGQRFYTVILRDMTEQRQ